MSFINRMKHGLDVTKFKADQALRINKVQAEINALEMQISTLLSEISKTTLTLHQQNNLMNPELKKLCADIDAVKGNIAEYETQIESIRAELAPIMIAESKVGADNLCPNCYFELPIGALFCPECGFNLPQPHQSENSVETTSLNACSQCNFQLAPEMEFCPKCGQPVQRIEHPNDEEEI